VARIRTVKPELFRHEELFDLENETGLPIRLAWIGLFTVADREGRFKWRARALKTEILPFDDLDFEHVLQALEAYGLIARYRSDEGDLGVIVSFKRHQCINMREAQSSLPAPTEDVFKMKASKNLPAQIRRPVLARADTCTCKEEALTPARVLPSEPKVTAVVSPLVINSLSKPSNIEGADAGTEAHVQARGEGKGKEGKGREREWKFADPSPDKNDTTELFPEATKASKETSPTGATWEAYREAYRQRYHVDPTRNATVNGQLANFVKRVPAEEAPAIAAFYVEHNHGYYLNAGHAIGLLLKDAEKLRTEWLTGKRITRNTVRAVETTDHFSTQLREIAEGRL